MEGVCISSRIAEEDGADEVHLPDLAHLGKSMESLKRFNDWCQAILGRIPPRRRRIADGKNESCKVCSSQDG